MSTITTEHAMTTTRAELLLRAEALAPELRARAAEGDTLRTMPADLAAAIKRLGLFRLALPATLGGWEADPLTIFEVIERLAYADGSAAWTVLIGNSPMFMAWLDPDVASGLLAGNPDIASTGVFAATGTAVSDERGAFTVDGRWVCNSGCAHSEWFVTGVVVTHDDQPRLRPDGRPDVRLAWLPATEGEIIDTWFAAGLKGSGSHDVVARQVRVPEERTCAPLLDRARHDGPLYRLSTYNLLSAFMAGFNAGVARRAVDEFIGYADTKRRGASPTTVADDPVVQHRIAVVDSDVRAGRAFYLDALDAAWVTVTNGDAATLQQRAAVMAAAQTLHRAALAAADALLPLAGAGAIYEDNPIQRCTRDLHAAAQHIFHSVDTVTQIGTVLLHRQPASPRF